MSSMFDPEPRKVSEEVDTSPSLQSTIIALDGTVVVVTVGGIGEGLDFERRTLTLGSCSTWLSLEMGEFRSVC